MHDEYNAIAKPFVKWVGGKSQLLSQYELLLPKSLDERNGFTYIEPFVGGGAMLFYMLQRYSNINRVIINDINNDLIQTYQVIKDQPQRLISMLINLQKRYQDCCSEFDRRDLYYALRDKYNSRCCQKIEMATLFIFLNRTCFNGLYRVNAKGKYNVSFGKYTNPLICDARTIMADSKLLQKVDILSVDFEQAFKGLSGNTFAYLDPPYRPLSQTSSFTGYSKDGFSDYDQFRLAKLCAKLDAKGVLWMMSNSDPHNASIDDDFFDNLYAKFEITRVSANRMVNSKVSGRGKITEIVVRNYSS